MERYNTATSTQILNNFDKIQENITPELEEENKSRIAQILAGASFLPDDEEEPIVESKIHTSPYPVAPTPQIDTPVQIKPKEENKTIIAKPTVVENKQKENIDYSISLDLSNLSVILNEYQKLQEAKAIKEAAAPIEHLYPATLSINVLSCNFDYVNVTETDLMLLFVIKGNFPISLESSVNFEKLKFKDLQTFEDKELLNVTCMGKPTSIPNTGYKVLLFFKVAP